MSTREADNAADNFPLPWRFTVEFHPPRPLTEAERARLRDMIGEAMAAFRETLATEQSR